MKIPYKARPASRWMGIAGMVAAAMPGLAQARPLDLVYERTVMASADDRCRLFPPGLSAALDAARVQARGAALRAGADSEDLRVTERRARDSAASTACDSPALALAAARVRDAFGGYARLDRMTYPGERAAWRADRAGRGAMRWRLVQETRFAADVLAFGLAGRDAPGVLLAVAQFQDGQAPYAAQIVLRDTRRADAPYFPSAPQRLPLDRRLPPASALRTFVAEARSPAGLDLLPRDGRPGWAFRFPAEAVDLLARLDSREVVAVDFLFAGDVTRRAYVEVGDFAAARAFLNLAQR
jgi:hypothetical protein